MPQVNVIISLGSERLHSDMVRRFDGHKTANDDPITVIKLDKSGGCADRDDTYLQQMRQAQIREYFFGDKRRTLSPHTQTVDFNSITIYKIRECKSITNCYPTSPFTKAPQEPLTTSPANSMLASFLPGGDEEPEDQDLFDVVTPSSQLLHCILAVLYASQHDSQDAIRDASVMGFVYVAEVDEKKQRMKILAPLSGKLGNRPMVWGSWPEAAVSLIG
jgi:polyribonucleotide 5'-hydroxyl-kinase